MSIDNCIYLFPTKPKNFTKFGSFYGFQAKTMAESKVFWSIDDKIIRKEEVHEK